MRRGISAWSLALILFALTPCQGTADPSTPTNVVRTFQSGLLDVMKQADNLGVQGRYERLRPLVEQTFHLPVMARIATGTYWDRADGSLKRRFVSSFVRMGVSTLATLFDGYSGESFAIVGERPPIDVTVIVKTQILRPDDSPVDIAYVTRRFDGRWYVIDVLLDGDVSELKVRKSEYRLVLRKGGIEALIVTLDNKADELLGQ